MDKAFVSTGNGEKWILKTPLFTLYDHQILINHKKEMNVFNLNKISNVRLYKKRNISINIVLAFSTLLAYSIISDYSNKNSYANFFVFLVFTILSVISLSIKNYTNVLLINMGAFHFREFKLSKKQSPYAEHFISIFKIKYKKIKHQNDIDLLNLKHFS